MQDKTDLYVMQNHLGLIKIGQSRDVGKRHTYLARADRCQIKIVHVVRNGGSKEKECLRLLSKHQAYGEWFNGNLIARQAIEQVCQLPADVTWPFPTAQDQAVETWLNQLGELRSFTSKLKLSRRLVRDMERNEARASDEFACRYYDIKIWQIIWEYDHGLTPWVWDGIGEDGKEIRLAVKDAGTDPEPLPKFTTLVSDALLAWPTDYRPKIWNGDAWECCIEGLKVRRSIMRGRSRASHNQSF